MSGNRGQRGMGDRGGRGGGGRGFDNRGGGGGRGRGFDDRGGRGGGRGGGGFRGPIGPTIFMENTPAQLPTRLTDNSQNALIASFGTVAKTHGPERPLRPGFGTLGVAITLRANFFPVRLPSSPQTLYDYSVKVSPSQTPNAIVRRLFELLERDPIVQPHVAHLAHDYSQRIVSRQLLPEPLKVRIPFHDEDETGPNPNAKIYTLTITLYKTLEPQILKKYLDGDLSLIDFDIQPHISAYNLISQRHAATTGRRTGKNIPKYFFDSGEKNNLSPGVFAWQGFSTSVRPVFKQLMINVNICVSAFVLPGNLADALMEFNRNSQGAMPSLPNRMTESIKIRTIHLGYKKSLKAIGTQSARNCRFSCEEFNDSNMSVEKYFSKKYSIKLQYPVELPVVDIGSQKRPVWIPAELCEILPGCQLKGKLNETETANMIRYACKVPRINAETIVSRGLPTLGLSPAARSLNEFGLSIAADMATIPGRELPPPGLKYRSGNTRPNAGSWNILDVKFQRGAVVTSWWVLVVKDGKGIIQGPQDPNLIGLVDGFAAKLSKSGMTVPPGKPRLLPVVLERKRTDTIRAADLDTIRQKLKTTMQEKGKPTFVLVLLENRDNYIYPGIKRIGDVELGIHTVHMQLSKALGDERKQDQYFSNVALKVNTKLGGLNHLLDDRATSWLRKKKTMMVGIDVTHPGPGSKPGTPSISAVVASVDDSFVQFPGSIRIQGSRNEMLHELSEMLRERLHVYEKKNKTLPERIFVYRDGVSEGQFDQTVIQLELPQILDAFEKMNTKDRKVTYRPQLAIIVCGKRHHAKFFPTNSQFADRNGNTRPGTVVDRGVTGVFDFDFYLQAHAGLQGHVKSTHYTVVYDEMGLTADEIQQGTHDASYLYARATKAVSLIPAAYYADLACERGRCYLNDFLVTDDKLSLSKYTRLSRLEQDQERARVFDAAKRHWGGGLNPDLRETMFYI